MTRLPPLITTEQFLIDKDLSGGCRLRLGPASFVMSPDETVKAAQAMLAVVGIELKFTSASPIVRAQA